MKNQAQCKHSIYNNFKILIIEIIKIIRNILLNITIIIEYNIIIIEIMENYRKVILSCYIDFLTLKVIVNRLLLLLKKLLMSLIMITNVIIKVIIKKSQDMLRSVSPVTS